MTPQELAPIWAAYWGQNDIIATEELEPGITMDRHLTQEHAHELLVRHFLPLANYLARKALAKAPAHQDAEDIHSYAHHGLLDAISRFRPDAGAKFETYATRRITGAIIDGQRSQDPLTRAGRRTVKTMEAAVEQLWTDLGREPTAEEIAEVSGLEVDVVRATFINQQTLNASLDDWRSGEDVGDWFDPDRQRAFKHHHGEGEDILQAQVVEVSALLAHRLAAMGIRERAVALLHYCDGLSMEETARVIGVGSDACTHVRAAVLEAVRGA